MPTAAEIIDAVFPTARNILGDDEAFQLALAKGELTPEAIDAIGAALDGAFDRAQRLQNIFLAEPTARKAITGYMFQRAFAATAANAAYRKAFSAAAPTRAADPRQL